MSNLFDFAAALHFLEGICQESDHPRARFWSEYWLKTGHIRRLFGMIERMKPLLEPDTVLLDIGGFGELPLLLWKFFGLASVRGVSLEGDLLAYGNGRLIAPDDPGIEFLIEIDECDIERQRLRYRDGELDLVTSFEVLEHLRYDPNFMMIEINRVLRPGGTLMLSTPNASSWETLARVADFDAPFTFSSYFADGRGIGHCKEYSIGELRRIVENAGFSVESIETLDVEQPGKALDEKYKDLQRFVAGRQWWKGELRKETQLIVGRKSGKPGLRMYQPLYTENFFYAEPSGSASESPATNPAEDLLLEVTRLREYVSRQKDEIDARTRWAQSNEKAILELRNSHEQFMQEFHARGEWAQWQDQEVENLRTKVAGLEEQLAEARCRIENRQAEMAALVASFRSIRFLLKKLARAIFERIGIHSWSGNSGH